MASPILRLPVGLSVMTMCLSSKINHPGGYLEKNTFFFGDGGIAAKYM